jgi:hypothetical protein
MQTKESVTNLFIIHGSMRVENSISLVKEKVYINIRPSSIPQLDRYRHLAVRRHPPRLRDNVQCKKMPKLDIM